LLNQGKAGKRITRRIQTDRRKIKRKTKERIAAAKGTISVMYEPHKIPRSLIKWIVKKKNGGKANVSAQKKRRIANKGEGEGTSIIRLSHAVNSDRNVWEDIPEKSTSEATLGKGVGDPKTTPPRGATSSPPRRKGRDYPGESTRVTRHRKTSLSLRRENLLWTLQKTQGCTSA